MKKIEAIIRHYRLEEVKHAIVEKGVEGMTITEVHCVGEEIHTLTYRGVTQTVDAAPKVRIEIVVADRQVEEIVDSIYQSAHTGDIGDGRIVVSDIESVTRIRTGETEQSDEDFIRHEAALRPRLSGLQRAQLPSYQHSS